ncbi:TraR/DksA C4-type zinc finger protein [Alkalicoccus urumqiensis]|uniref:Molecular chaperone DnaK n=1 Tax=Alkalicoccus urumqiensis TaxID=1548213 RepID=A0A2P6MKT9_ALKUR|nr:TraR/DksA C4-type zinc finger protein [Alkalicoccus urumqiensis]PRO66898.1 molecular chaperone DnaK [Alkalicoccus urumqiensis]
MDQEKLAYFKKKLLDRKEELTSRTHDNEGDTEELADYDNHPADQGTGLSEKHTDAALERKDEEELEEIEAALGRIEEGTYGVCEVSGEKIPEERLELVPTARTTVEHAGETKGPARPPEESVVSPIDGGARDSYREDFWDEAESHGSSSDSDTRPPGKEDRGS